MEPNKFDNIVREKLEQRTIQPSEMAWDRLDAMLSVAEEKTAKPKKKRTWLYIAASFLGFMLLGTIFMKHEGTNTTDIKSTDIQVAVTPEPTIKQSNSGSEPVISTPEEIIQEEAVAAVSASRINTAKSENKAAPKVNKQKGATSPQPMVTQEAIAQNTTTEIVNKALTLTEDPTLAVAEIDESKKPAVKVNANSLLSSVEGELDTSFRNKAMQAIVKNYNTVKTSVANRNHK